MSKDLIQNGLSYLETLKRFLKTKGFNLDTIMHEMLHQIQAIYLTVDSDMLQLQVEKDSLLKFRWYQFWLVTLTITFHWSFSRSNSSDSNFFELVRIDFILDSQAKPHLIEVQQKIALSITTIDNRFSVSNQINMSPNLHSSRFSRSAKLYQKVLANSMQLLRICHPLSHRFSCYCRTES